MGYFKIFNQNYKGSSTYADNNGLIENLCSVESAKYIRTRKYCSNLVLFLQLL